MKKFVNSIASIAILALLCSCTGKSNPALNMPASLAHKEMYAQLINTQHACKPTGDGKVVCTKKSVRKKKAVGNSWKGKWLFTIVNKDRTLAEGTVITKAQFDPIKKDIFPGEKVNPTSLTKDQVVYVGFTSLDEGVGYDVITNNKNAKMPLSGIKADGNKLQWTLNYEGDPKAKLFNQAMIFKTNANYNPGSDELVGETEFGMNYKSDKKTVYVPMGSYVWHASRISDYNFKALTNPGEFRADFPQYLVGIDSSDPKISKLLFDK